MRFAASLDPPGETKRQAWTLLVWLLFLGLAVVWASGVGTHVPSWADGAASEEANAELHRSRAARLRVAIVFGLLLPGVCSLLLSRRFRRGGAHARGITIELTDTELRLWGRGYGSRVTLEAAKLEERLVDVYAGRLGAWRQIRMRLKNRQQEIELAAPANQDEPPELRLDGGEGDCVEIAREDYERLKQGIVAKKSS
jgi:hypothetical protein